MGFSLLLCVCVVVSNADDVNLLRVSFPFFALFFRTWNRIIVENCICKFSLMSFHEISFKQTQSDTE